MTSRFSNEFWAGLRAQTVQLPQAVHDDPLTGEMVRNHVGRSAAGDAPDQRRHSSLVHSPKPISVCIPESYESNYPYPLIVWLHGSGGSERQLLQLMPRISTRNYLGLSLRGPLAADHVLPGGYDWSQNEQDLAELEDDLHRAVCQLRRGFNIHSERIYLAGFDSGATMALSLVLRRPEWFAGAVCLSGEFPQMHRSLSRFRDLQGTRILLGLGTRDRYLSLSGLVGTGRLLHSAGLDVTTRVFRAVHEVTDEMLGHINHWVMEDICSARLV